MRRIRGKEFAFGEELSTKAASLQWVVETEARECARARREPSTVRRPQRGVAPARRSQRRAHNKRALARLRRHGSRSPLLSASCGPKTRVKHAQTDARDHRREIGTINHKRAPGLLTLLELRPSADDCRSHEPSWRRRRRGTIFERVLLTESESQDRGRRAGQQWSPLPSLDVPFAAAAHCCQASPASASPSPCAPQQRSTRSRKWNASAEAPAKVTARKPTQRNATQRQRQERRVQSPRRTHERYF